MIAKVVPSLLQHVRRLAVTASSDEQLLADFLDRRSDDAFSALIGRHGPMVYNLCRRILRDAHAAEDVFQATFLVLADRASAIRRRASLAGFLHGVAYRLAVRARGRQKRLLPDAVRDGAVGPPDELAWKEMLGILDHELGRLSDPHRAPLVLCYLEGRTQDEAARQLGWSVNTLRRRLAKGRRLLEVRLRGRGVTLSSALAGLLAARAVAVPGPVRAATIAAAGARAGGVTALATAGKGIGLILSASGKKVLALVAVAVVGVAVCFGYLSTSAEPAPATSEPPPKARAVGAGRGDPTADPLPARGAVRIGTARYRPGSRIESMAVSDDGKLAVVAGEWHSHTPARVFDLTDGLCLHTIPVENKREVEAVGVSPDGKMLAVKDDGQIIFRDAVTGKVLRKMPISGDGGGSRSVTDWLTFTPDGKQIAAVLMGEAIRLIDVESAKVVTTFNTAGAASACVFSPDGKVMATGGYGVDQGMYHVQLWDVGTGKELRRIPVVRFPAGNGGRRSLAFSPDGAMLAGGGWGDGRLRLWDVATGKEQKVLPKNGQNIESVAFAPDGKTVAAASDKIYLYDPRTGKERLRIDRRARRLSFNRDSTVLTGAISGAIYRWDAAGGRQLTPAAAQDTGVERITVTDKRRLFTIDQDGDLYAWDTTGRQAPRRIAGGVGRGAVASPDGRFLAWAEKHKYGGSQLRLYDVRAKRFIDRFPVSGDISNVEAILPDGKTLVTVNGSGSAIRLWDVESGKVRRSFAAYSEQVPLRRVGYYPYTGRRVVLSPDGKTLAIADMDRNLPVGLWDLTTGKAIRELDVRLTSVNAAAASGVRELGFGGRRINGFMSSGNGLSFSPDGRYLVTCSENPFGKSKSDHVIVWEVATGRKVAQLTSDGADGAGCVAFAPDGRTLAAASLDGTIRLWEVATWKIRTEFRGHRDRITALTFGPDGRLYSGGLDTVVLGWDVRPPHAPAPGTLADAWKSLTRTDAKAAFEAQGRLLAEPDRAVEWIAARIHPASAPDPARVKTLVADLDSNHFPTRERATEELRGYGPAVTAALREVVAKSSSAEARRRAAGMLRELKNGVNSPRELQAVRAVEVLEWIAAKDARGLLHKLAKGTPSARLTSEAAAAGKRLEARK
jgi:RNA polymerase sigma factor (sigma-70 family)